MGTVAVRPRGARGQVHPAAHGRRVVPLVPRHGAHDLPRCRHPAAHRREIHRRARRPGFRPRALLPLRELGLACHHHARQGRQRDLQAPRLHPARAVRQAFGRRHRGSVGTDDLHSRRHGRPQRRRALGRASRPHRGLAAEELRQGQRRLRRHPSLHPWRHARMGAGARPRPAAQRRARGVARDVGPHTGRRAPPDRSGVGRHVPVLRQARLVGPALREAFEHPARCPARLCAGLPDRRRSRRPCRGARHRPLADGFHARADRRLLHQPGCRCRPDPAWRRLLRQDRRRAPRRPAAADRPQCLCARERLGDRESRRALRRHRRAGADRRRRPRLRLGAGRAPRTQRRLRPCPRQRRRHPSRRHAVDGRGRARALSQHRRAALPQPLRSSLAR